MINFKNEKEKEDFFIKLDNETKERIEKNKLYEINRIKKLQCPNCNSYKKEQFFNHTTQKYLDKNITNLFDEYFTCQNCKKDYFDAADTCVLCEQINSKIKKITLFFLNKTYIGRTIGNLLLIEMTAENAQSAPYILHDEENNVTYSTLNKDIGNLQIESIQTSKIHVQIFYNDGKEEYIYIIPYKEIFGIHQKFKIIERC